MVPGRSRNHRPSAVRVSAQAANATGKQTVSSIRSTAVFEEWRHATVPSPTGTPVQSEQLRSMVTVRATGYSTAISADQDDRS